MEKKKIALVTGGFSGEAQISYKSAATILKNIDKEQFEVYTIDICKEGWLYEDGNGNRVPVNKNDFSILQNGQTIHFDAVYICIHGTPGEDGKLQGYFDMLGIPYTGCDATTSALTFNKRFTVAAAAFSGIAVAKSVHLYHSDSFSVESLFNQLTLPVFVKPNNGGSSIGMSKVTRKEDLQAAIEKAFREDKQVLIEEFVEGREFTAGVFKTKGNIIVLPLTEVKSKKEFFDFQAKYEGFSIETTPALVEESIAEQVRQAAKKIYHVFNCKGIIRIDFIYNAEKQMPFMLEVNTIPGQSEASVVPQQVKAMGWSLHQFYTALLEECFS